MNILKVFIFLSLYCLPASGQNGVYSTVNAHSHNDYEQDTPFFKAYKAQFGSIEADIHLVNGALLVGHNSAELKEERTLEKMYLDPVTAYIEKNRGHIYPDSSKSLQLLIDLKTEGLSTLNALVSVLNKYPLIVHSRTVRIVISGNRPAERLYTSYPSYIWFDGSLEKKYSPVTLLKIAMFSDRFGKYSRWDGKGPFPVKDRKAITALVDKAHLLHKPIRFWAIPDGKEGWEEMIKMGVDYINTDDIEALAGFLQQEKDTWR